MASKSGNDPQTFGVTDYLMAFKIGQPGGQAFYDLYYQKDQINTFIKKEGFLPSRRPNPRGLRRRR